MDFVQNVSMGSTRLTTFATLAIRAVPLALIPLTVSPARQDTIGVYRTEDSARHVLVDVRAAIPQATAQAAWRITTFSNQTVSLAQSTATDVQMVLPAPRARQEYWYLISAFCAQILPMVVRVDVPPATTTTISSHALSVQIHTSSTPTGLVSYAVHFWQEQCVAETKIPQHSARAIPVRPSLRDTILWE